ncbi:hypothetical protein BH23ACT6_BH23ACT6_25020 [soil metagenome]
MIVNEEQRAAMGFIATVNRGGYRPTGREVNEWRLRPDVRPRQRGRLLEPAVAAVPERRVRQWPSSTAGASITSALSQFASFSALMNSNLPPLSASTKASIAAIGRMSALGLEDKIISGKPGRPAKYAPDRPAEKFLAHLRRLGWVERDRNRRYGVTLLGHALLRAEASVDSGDEDSAVMVLTAEDDLAYGRVLGLIAECGDALIVDGYLDAAELVHLLKDSDAARFLVSSKLSRNRMMQLAIQIRTAPPNKEGVVRELRQANFHDRYLIGDHKVYGLGSSLNGVGKNMTTLIEMPDSAAQMIRDQIESLWDSAEVIAQTEAGEVEGALGGDVQPASSSSASQSKDSIFQHDECQIRHRSRVAAERCTKGRSVGT